MGYFSKKCFSLVNWPVGFGEEKTAKILSDAFDVWSRYSGLAFRRSRDYYDSDINILFSSFSHGDG